MKTRTKMRVIKAAYLALALVLSLQPLSRAAAQGGGLYDPDGLGLINAIRWGDLDRVRATVESGVDINRRYNFPAGNTILSWTPLIAAVIDGKKEVVEYLVEMGADVDAQDWAFGGFGQTPLMHAVRNRHKGIVERLIEAGADVNATATKGWSTALDIALVRGFADIADLLRAAGAAR